MLKMKEVEKMDVKTRKTKIEELKMELSRANVAANKANSKTKEIKKAIARIITFNRREFKNSQTLKKQK
jgi:ribosomal protein L29